MDTTHAVRYGLEADLNRDIVLQLPIEWDLRGILAEHAGANGIGEVLSQSRVGGCNFLYCGADASVDAVAVGVGSIPPPPSRVEPVAE